MPALCFTVLTRFVGEPVAFVATFIVVWNTLLVTGFDDWSNVHHDPMVAFPLLAAPNRIHTQQPNSEFAARQVFKLFLESLCLTQSQPECSYRLPTTHSVQDEYILCSMG
jgi:hypothetical protein